MQDPDTLRSLIQQNPMLKSMFNQNPSMKMILDNPQLMKTVFSTYYLIPRSAEFEDGERNDEKSK